MYRIRFHGRGGQGMKTASRILGRAFFLAGFEVQDAPRYGAERRGAPIFAYVRADLQPIQERGIITRPDLIIVADDSLLAIVNNDILTDAEARTLLLIRSCDEPHTWQQRLDFNGKLIVLPVSTAEQQQQHIRFIGIACAAAASRLIPALTRDHLQHAITTELQDLPAELVAQNLAIAEQAFAHMAPHSGSCPKSSELSVTEARSPQWTKPVWQPPELATPAIQATRTTARVATGLWRTMRPVVNPELCHHCAWICASSCPDGVIGIAADGSPQIDYQHCKGCLICQAQCPHHAIAAIPENEETGGGS